MSFANIYFQAVTYLCLLLTVSFAEQKFLILDFFPKNMYGIWNFTEPFTPRKKKKSQYILLFDKATYKFLKLITFIIGNFILNKTGIWKT